MVGGFFSLTKNQTMVNYNSNLPSSQYILTGFSAPLKEVRGSGRETFERNNTWVYLGNLLYHFLFIICFVSMGPKCLLCTEVFFSSPYVMSSWWLLYFERIKEVSASMFAFRPVGAVSFLIWLHHFLTAAKPGFSQHPALGTYQPGNSLIPLEH